MPLGYNTSRSTEDYFEFEQRFMERFSHQAELDKIPEMLDKGTYILKILRLKFLNSCQQGAERFQPFLFTWSHLLSMDLEQYVVHQCGTNHLELRLDTLSSILNVYVKIASPLSYLRSYYTKWRPLIL